MEYNRVFKKVASNLDLEESLVRDTYRAYWRTIREHIKSLPLKEDLSTEEFSKLKTSVNIPSIGKFYVSFDKYKRIKELYNNKE